jgi:hypothetical protein
MKKSLKTALALAILAISNLAAANAPAQTQPLTEHEMKERDCGRVNGVAKDAIVMGSVERIVMLGRSVEKPNDIVKSYVYVLPQRDLQKSMGLCDDPQAGEQRFEVDGRAAYHLNDIVNIVTFGGKTSLGAKSTKPAV